jgi:HK97 family phage major capsid protein
MAFQEEYGIDVEEALSLEEDEKAGAVFSRANKSKLRQALQVLKDLVGDEEGEEDDLAGADGNGVEPDPMHLKGGGRGPASAGAAKPRTNSKPDPFATVRGTGKSLSSDLDEERPGTKALNTHKGVQTTMSAKTQEKPNVEGDEDQDTLTFTGIEAKAIREMLTERDELKKTADAKAIAEAQVEKERKDAEEAAAAKRKYDEEVQAKAVEIAKQLRTGSTMNFGGDAAGAGAGGAAAGAGAKSFYVNRGAASDKNQFSFLKFARFGKEGREWQYIENQKSMDADYKALNETIGEQGGYLVPIQQSSEIVDLLRTQAVVRQMPGVRVIPMTSDTLTMARLVGGAKAYWVAEGATMTQSAPNFGQIKFVARKLAAVVPITKEVMADSNPGIEQIVREDIAAALALEEDNAFLQGTGNNEQPLGILNTPGVTSIAYSSGAASAAPELKALIKGTGIVRANNGKPNGIVHNSRIGDQLLGVVDTTGQPVFANAIGGYRWNDLQAAAGRTSNDPNQVQFGSLVGLVQAFTNQLAMSANTTGTGPVIIGDWRNILIGERQGLEVEMDRSQGFFNDVVYIKVTKRTDMVVALPKTFVAITAFPGIDIA